MNRRRIGVLGEAQDLSLKTVEAVAVALEARGHEVVRLSSGPGLDLLLSETAIDVAFLALPGPVAEEGAVQRLLEVMGIPYTGAGVLASALALNRGFSKKLFRTHNIATAPGYTVSAERLHELETLHGDLGFPCVVKPGTGSGPDGTTVVTHASALREAVERACQPCGEALVERFVKGRQVTVALLGEAVVGTCEVHGAKVHVPPRLSATRVTNLEAMAQTAMRALRCAGPALVDFVVPEHGNEVLVEVNTVPELLPGSLLPKVARAHGRSYGALCESILAHAALENVFERTRSEPVELTAAAVP